ncbi:unnamed protein product [Strongylus vulgaris]|uniref:Domain of unknown function DB domain-containing protein n=1 Tax=Strongylus vulgaris TaxID=40348 RepID=A0A3P7HWN6_STRVU|nr:unnamed protein product [Strongylus vulgaris]
MRLKKQSLPEGAYGAEEKLTDGHHPSYIEDTARTTPVDQFKKVVQPKIVAPRPVTRGPVPKFQPQARMMTTRLPPLPLAKPQAVVIPAKSIPPPSSVAKLTGMFLGTDPCPQSYGLDLLQCAAQNDDHTTCCRERGVHKTSAGDKCLGFCNMRPGVNFQVREATTVFLIEFILLSM